MEELDAINNPEDERAGKRRVPFSKVLYIERDDFMEDPPRKFFRLAPGREVRLRYAYFITCTDVIKDADGNVVELRCAYDPDTRGGAAPMVGASRRPCTGSRRSTPSKPKRACMRLCSAKNTRKRPRQRLYGFRQSGLADRCRPIYVEPHVKSARAGDRFQFERLAYFVVDEESTAEKLVFNRTVTLRDQWRKAQRGPVNPPSADAAVKRRKVSLGGQGRLVWE